MAIQYVNTGSGPNSNDGDSIRSAFNKVNQNFDELTTLIGTTATNFTELAQDAAASLLVHSSHTGLTAVYDDALNIIELQVTDGAIGPSGPSGPSGPPGASTTATGGANITADVNPPASPTVGDLWYDTASGKTFVYYDNSWVDSNPSSYGPASDIVVDRGTINGTVTFNRNLGSVHTFTLDGNLVITDILNMFSGRNITFIVTQDSVGGRTITLPSNTVFAGGANSISTSPNAVDMINMFQAGSTIYAVITTGYV